MAIKPSILETKDGFEISQTDASSDPRYYLHLRSNGKWRIMKESDDGSYRYAHGGYSMDHVTAWTNRASLGYSYFDDSF